jgi:hypothetical protein
MGAAFLCGQSGISETTLENSASYIQNWLERLQNDEALIVVTRRILLYISIQNVLFVCFLKSRFVSFELQHRD